MITYLKKDITTVEQGIVAHGVNTLGVMGAGAALAIRHKWIKAYTEYATLCRNSYKNPQELLGTVQIVDISSELVVANCFTQLSFGRYEVHASAAAIKESLESVVDYAKVYFNQPIYMPKIGSGLGGLSWEFVVEPIIYDISLVNQDVQIFVCEL